MKEIILIVLILCGTWIVAVITWEGPSESEMDAGPNTAIEQDTQTAYVNECLYPEQLGAMEEILSEHFNREDVDLRLYGWNGQAFVNVLAGDTCYEATFALVPQLTDIDTSICQEDHLPNY